MPASWTRLCSEHALGLQLPPGATAPLEAFAGGREATSADFAVLLEESRRVAGELPKRIRSALDGEVDAQQAAMFARRFADVRAQLVAIPGDEALLLEVGLVQRTAEVLAASAPRALRVRAVADFFYSHAGLLHHRPAPGQPAPPTVAERVGRARWSAVGPGVWWARVAGITDQGPVHLNLLRVRAAQLVAVDCRGRGSLVEVAAQEGAVAAISGGFFLYSEPDIAPPSRRGDPVGLLVTGGQVRGLPAWRRSALVQRDDGSMAIEVLGMEDVTVRWPGGEVRAVATNDLGRLGEGPVAFNRAFGPRAPSRPGFAMVGREVVAHGVGLAIPLAGCVVVDPGTRPPRGGVEVVIAGRQAAMAGGPRILTEGRVRLDLGAEQFAGTAPPITFSQDETFDQNLLPRMAAGLTAEGELVVAAVDGRNFDAALGMTLRQTAGVLASLGCVEALNLDGGSSKRMVVAGEVVDLPSTEVVAGGGGSARVRPVHSAILFRPLSE